MLAAHDSRCYYRATWLRLHSSVLLDQFLGSSVELCPYTRWYSQVPSAKLLNSLRVWGSIVYFKHHEDRHKLEMPGHKGMFLGYSNMSNGVYLRDLDNKKKPVCITECSGSCAPSPTPKCKSISAVRMLRCRLAVVPAPIEFEFGPPSPVLPDSTSGGVGIRPHTQIPQERGHVLGQVQGKSQVKLKAKVSFRLQSSETNFKLVLRETGSQRGSVKPWTQMFRRTSAVDMCG